MEVQPLAGRVGGEEDAQGVARGVGVEAALDLAAAGAAGQVGLPVARALRIDPAEVLRVDE